jgi:hypothetical protein
MNKIKLIRSVLVNKDNYYESSDFYTKLSHESYRQLSNYINPRSKNENILEHIEMSVITSTGLNLTHFVKSYFSGYDIEEESIKCRANKKIKVSISNVEILKVDSNCKDCEFIIHFISEEYYFKSFAGNSVLVSPLTDGLHTLMIDFDSKEVAVEYLDVKQMN